jgi:hypothetical protein
MLATMKLPPPERACPPLAQQVVETPGGAFHMGWSLSMVVAERLGPRLREKVASEGLPGAILSIGCPANNQTTLGLGDMRHD